MADREDDSNKKQSFWTTLPGILTGCAAVVTAVGGLIGVLYSVGIIGPSTPSPTLVPPSTMQEPTSTSQIPTLDVPQPHEGQIAYYSFAGDPNDQSGKGNHGTVNGAQLTLDRTGNTDSAYSFDGQDDSIQVPDDPSFQITEQISLVAWVLPMSQKTQEIVRKGPEVNGPTAAPYSLALSGTGDIVFSLRPDLQFTQLRKIGYPLNEWFFIVATYDGTIMNLYVNGNLENSALISGILNQNSSPLLIGTRLNLPADTFHGNIDEVHIYDYALSEAEVTALYEERETRN